MKGQVVTAAQLLAGVQRAVRASQDAEEGRAEDRLVMEAVIGAWDFTHAVSLNQEMPGADGAFYSHAAETLLVAVALGVAIAAPQGQATPPAVLATLRDLSADRSGRSLDRWLSSLWACHGSAGCAVMAAYMAALEAAGPLEHVQATVRTIAQLYLRQFGAEALTAWTPCLATGQDG